MITIDAEIRVCSALERLATALEAYVARQAESNKLQVAQMRVLLAQYEATFVQLKASLEELDVIDAPALERMKVQIGLYRAAVEALGE